MTLDDFTALSISHQRERELERTLELRRQEAERATTEAGGRLALISRLAREARHGTATVRPA